MVNKDFIELVREIFHDHTMTMNTYSSICLKKHEVLIKIHNYNDLDYNHSTKYHKMESTWYFSIDGEELMIKRGYERFLLTDLIDVQLPLIYKRNEYNIKIGDYIKSMSSNDSENYIISSLRESTLNKLENGIGDKN